MLAANKHGLKRTCNFSGMKRSDMQVFSWAECGNQVLKSAHWSLIPKSAFHVQGPVLRLRAFRSWLCVCVCVGGGGADTFLHTDDNSSNQHCKENTLL